jgi:uncharacterized protein (DUF1697 family)
MAELRACFNEMGFDDATTIQQTGNVIFVSTGSPSALKRTIESGLGKRFNYPAHVQVFKMARLRQIVESSPFDGNDPHMHSYIVFFEDGLEEKLLAEARDLDGTIESIEAGEGVLYWRVPKGSTLQSVIAKYLTKARYKHFHTNRNINTLLKIVN